ncbi:predicted protein [Histoplasma capsulatum H143]|uniref:Uncharacterized protein n=1 Tax=Ajellomyces capsulatus (strain H143) TaxID=544712 RepID=C6HJN7_AJECH|nr:predicted protein [Histoplasma capsulatum H143]
MGGGRLERSRERPFFRSEGEGEAREAQVAVCEEGESAEEKESVDDADCLNMVIDNLKVSAADILQIATQDSIVARVARKAARRADPSAASDDVTGGEERSQQALRRTMAQQLAANGLESWSGVLVCLATGAEPRGWGDAGLIYELWIIW